MHFQICDVNKTQERTGTHGCAYLRSCTLLVFGISSNTSHKIIWPRCRINFSLHYKFKVFFSITWDNHTIVITTLSLAWLFAWPHPFELATLKLWRLHFLELWSCRWLCPFHLRWWPRHVPFFVQGVLSGLHILCCEGWINLRVTCIGDGGNLFS